MSFAVIDFYDHDSQHTVPLYGDNGNYAFEVNFKVIMDESLVQYF